MIIITGASKGIGNYLFKEFNKNKFDVIGTYNNSPLDIENYCNKLYKIDIANYNEVYTMLESIKSKLTNIILINCAGISYNSFAHKADIEKWNKVIDVNLKGTFNLIQCLLPIMREQGYGRIINFSSVVTSLPIAGISAYIASKCAINGLTKALAIENASKGITVNAINLGYSNIGMGIDEVPENLREILKQKIPMKRFCEPFEILDTINFIINTEYVNGSILDINGGII